MGTQGVAHPYQFRCRRTSCEFATGFWQLVANLRRSINHHQHCWGLPSRYSYSFDEKIKLQTCCTSKPDAMIVNLYPQLPCKKVYGRKCIAINALQDVHRLETGEFLVDTSLSWTGSTVWSRGGEHKNGNVWMAVLVETSPSWTTLTVCSVGGEHKNGNAQMAASRVGNV